MVPLFSKPSFWLNACLKGCISDSSGDNRRLHLPEMESRGQHLPRDVLSSVLCNLFYIGNRNTGICGINLSLF